MTQLNSAAAPYVAPNSRVSVHSQQQQLLQQQQQLANMQQQQQQHQHHSGLSSPLPHGAGSNSSAAAANWLMNYQASGGTVSMVDPQMLQQLSGNPAAVQFLHASMPLTLQQQQHHQYQQQLQQIQAQQYQQQFQQAHYLQQIQQQQQQQAAAAQAASNAAAVAAQGGPSSYVPASSHPSSMTHTPAPPQGLPSLSQCPMIRDVWAQNLEEEFAVIRSLIADYPYVAMDTEFPGVVAKPVGSFKSPTEFYYQTLRVNVNMLKIIQVGMTLLNEKGEVPEQCCTWQFNFAFSVEKDTYATDSIQLLVQGGINFSYFSAYGIDMNHFASLLLSSGLVRNPDVRWLAFHAGYDFGYLTKVLYNSELPEREEDFLKRFHLLFPSTFDIKYLLRQTSYSHSYGLDYLSDMLKVRRFGNAHQAGSDSLLTGHCYFRLLADHFQGVEPRQGNGVLYGLTEDTEASEAAGSAAAAASNASHHQTSGNGAAAGGAAAASNMSAADGNSGSNHHGMNNNNNNRDRDHGHHRK